MKCGVRWKGNHTNISSVTVAVCDNHYACNHAQNIIEVATDGPGHSWPREGEGSENGHKRPGLPENQATLCTE